MTRSVLVAVVLTGAVACSSKSEDAPKRSTCGTHAPVASATAAPSSVAPGSAVQLTATSTDEDDACLAAPETRTYRWRIESRPPTSSAVVSDPGSPAPTLTPDVPGSYQLEVVATDAAGHASAPVFVTIEATACSLVAPTASIAAAFGTTFNPITLQAPTVSDGNCLASGALTYRWELVSRPAGSSAVLSDSAAASPVLFPDVVGLYQVSVVVTDSAGISSAPATATVAVASCGLAVPVVPALVASTAGGGAPNAGDLVTVALSGSITSGNVACGAAVEPYRYRWALVASPAGSRATLTSDTAPAPSFVADVPNGVWQLALTVTDALGNSSAPAFLTVATTGCGALPPLLGGAISFSAQPHANAPFTARAPAAVDGNAACPARFQGATFSYAFALVGAPAGASVRIDQNGSSSAAITADRGGTYSIQVVATSSAGLSSAPLVTAVPVSACGSFPPVATAFQLSQGVPTSGGGTSVVGEAVPVAGAAAAAAGSYYAGVPLQIAATVVDPDAGAACAALGLPAQPTSFSWSLAQVPATSLAALAFPGRSSISFVPDVPGTYTLALTTTDAGGGASTSTVTVSVPCGAAAPLVASLSAAQAGLVSTPSAPVSLAVGAPVALGAVALDPDATAGAQCSIPEAQPLSYQWSFSRLPPGSQAALLGADTATPSFVPDVATNASGTPAPYGLTVVVTDPQGHTASASLDVTVTCDAAPPAVATVPGTSVPDFTVSQQVPGILAAAGSPFLSTLTLVRGSAPGASATWVNASPVAGSVPFYPGFPLQVAANVPTFQTSAGCGIYPQVLSYGWSLRTVPAGSSAALSGASGPSPSFVPDVPGVYELQLVLTDALGRSTRTLLGVDTTGTAVLNVGSCGRHAPVAVARAVAPIASGSAGTGIEPLAIRTDLDASGSVSPDASPFLAGGGGCGLSRPLTYAWSLVSVPPGSTAALSGTGLVDPSIVLDLPGSYALRLDVSDGSNVGGTTLQLTGSPGYVSTPAAATGAAFTATATDGAGNPVVAWWDNVSGTVAAARCTAGCRTATPTWKSLGTVDAGLAPMTFGPEDEPRPVAVAVSGATTYVAYSTGSGGALTTGLHGMATCGVAVAVHDGTSWVSWTPLLNSVGLTGSIGCSASGTPPYFNYELGRWISMQLNGGVPVVAFWAVVGTSATQPQVAACTTPACTAVTAAVALDAGPGLRGRWPSLAVDSAGALHAAYYVDDDGAGARGLRYVTNASGSFQAAVVESSTTVDAGRYASLARAPANPPAGSPGPETITIAYRDASARVGKVVRCARSGITCPLGTPAVIADPSSTDAGRGTVLAVDPSTGNLRLGYLDAGGGVVRVFASSDGQAFSSIAGLPVTVTSPIGLSMAFGTSTVVGFSRKGTGPGVFTGP